MRKSLVCVLAVTTLVAGCGTPASPLVPQRPSASVPAPVPPDMVKREDIRGAKAPTECPDGAQFVPQRSSLRPRGPLPPPGTTPTPPFLAEIVERGKLRAGVDQNLSKFGAINPLTGALEGFDVDVVKEIAKAIFGDENRIELVPVNFENNFAKLAAGDVDIVADSITITCERRQERDIMFSSDYYFAGQRVMVPKSSPVREIEDLRGKRVCAPNGTTSIGTIVRPDLGLEPVAVTEFSDCLVLLQQRQVDAISTTDGILYGLIAQDPTTHMVGRRLSGEHHGLAMRETDEEFVRFVNGVLEHMRAHGTWKRLYEKWLADLEPGEQQPPVAEYVDQETG